jgi:hypothetical protein
MIPRMAEKKSWSVISPRKIHIPSAFQNRLFQPTWLMEIHWVPVLKENRDTYKSIGMKLAYPDTFMLRHGFNAGRMFCAKILTSRQDMDLGKQ